MNYTEYCIEQKHNGAWFGLTPGTNWLQIHEEIKDLRKEHPDREYQLVKLETKREVIG